MRKRARSHYPKRTPEQWLSLKEDAVARFGEEQSARAVTEALNVSNEPARVWFNEWQQGGAEAVCVQKPYGPKPRLLPEHCSRSGTLMIRRGGVPRSIQAFKGLEAPVVVLTDIEAIDDDRARSLLYVGITRAVEHLVMLVHRDAKSSINAALRGG